MGIKLADAVTYLTADSKGLDRELSQSESRLTKWGSMAQGMMMGAGIGIFNAVAGGVRSAIGQIGDSITAASDLNEAISKTGVIFGESADDLINWAGTAAEKFGQTKQQALDAATTFGLFGEAAGLSGDDLVDFSKGFTELASDLASFNNTSPEQAIQAIGAALRGETEPMRAYGVLMDDAALRQAAFNLGLVESTKEPLTAQQKVLAAQSLIYEQTAKAQGDFARTSDGYANQQRELFAKLADFMTTVGQAILPALTPLINWANDLAETYLPKVTGFITDTLVPKMGEFAASVARLWEWVAPNLQKYFFEPIATLFGGFKSGLEGGASDSETFAGKLGNAFGAGARFMRENLFDKLPGWWGEFREGWVGNVTAGDTWAARLGSLFGTAAGNLRSNLFDKLPGWWENFRGGFLGNETSAGSWAGELGRIMGAVYESVSDNVGRILGSLREISTWFDGEGQTSGRSWGEAILTIVGVAAKALIFMGNIVTDLINAFVLAGKALRALRAEDWTTLQELYDLSKEVANRTNPFEFMGALWKELEKMRQPPVTPGPAAPANQTFLPGVIGGGGAGNVFNVQIMSTGNGAQDLIGAAQFLQAMYG